MTKAHPRLHAELVWGSVQTAYGEFRHARVRTYLPVPMECRARDLLASEGRSERDA
ncbi:three-helix bundle dimerization domain-containing protein [Streptomyces yangpuensis]|uniref:three-helix bundle dimerization domain-containing protein n=1 Tax=Streptomyces yangpuensis TaxID=1648182 RepID=UPI00364862E5